MRVRTALFKPDVNYLVIVIKVQPSFHEIRNNNCDLIKTLLLVEEVKIINQNEVSFG